MKHLSTNKFKLFRNLNLFTVLLHETLHTNEMQLFYSCKYKLWTSIFFYISAFLVSFFFKKTSVPPSPPPPPPFLSFLPFLVRFISFRLRTRQHLIAGPICLHLKPGREKEQKKKHHHNKSDSTDQARFEFVKTGCRPRCCWRRRRGWIHFVPE